jgi:hypothetical protein
MSVEVVGAQARRWIIAAAEPAVNVRSGGGLVLRLQCGEESGYWGHAVAPMGHDLLSKRTTWVG